MPKPKTKELLKEIYTLIVESLKASVPDIEGKLGYYRDLDCKDWSDDDFFEVMVRTIFTGIRDETIEKRWPAITKAFSNLNIHKVAKYTEKDVRRLMKNKRIIRHKGRIRATISNAKQMEQIIREHGSFANYINSFSSLETLIEKLQGCYGGFSWIGEVNVYEFAKELGLPFIKPDIQVRKVFLRLGLINKKASLKEVLDIGKDMAEEVKERPCVVDWALWSFGNQTCKAKPECEKCRLTKICKQK
jgi:DNA-3-methyladenine glycosylase I